MYPTFSLILQSRDRIYKQLHQNQAESGYLCGTLKYCTNHQHHASRNKPRKLMREAGVEVRHRKKFKVTTDSNQMSWQDGGNRHRI